MSITIVDFEDAPKVNPYTEHVAALIEAGEGKAIKVTVPVGDLNKTKLKFAKAANAADKTARVKGIDDAGVTVGKDGAEVGDVTITFTLTEKHAARTRKPKDADAEVESE